MFQPCPLSLDELEQRISDEIDAIPADMIRRACRDLVRRCQLLIQNNGGYIEQGSSDKEETDIHQFFSTSWYSNFTLLYFSLHYWLNQWTVYVNEMSHVINYELIVINWAWITSCCNDMLQSIVFFVAQTRALIIFLFMLIRLTTPLVLSSMASICLIDSTVRPRASLVVETRDQVMGLGFTWNLNQFLISASSQVWCAKPNLINLR